MDQNKDYPMGIKKENVHYYPDEPKSAGTVSGSKGPSVATKTETPPEAVKKTFTEPGKSAYKNPRTEDVYRQGNMLKERSFSFLDSKKGVAVHELSKLESAFHKTADNLKGQNDMFASYADALANNIEKAAHFIDNKKTEEIFTAVNDFTRKNPLVTFGGFFLTGLFVSRFLRVSQDH